MGTPDWSLWLETGPWSGSGGGIDFSAIPALVSNVVVGSNPTYGLQDFLALYPKWGGPAVPITATLNGTETVSYTGTPNLVVGSPIAGPGIPDGTTITALSTNSFTISNAATASGAASLTTWSAPLIPWVVLQTYIALASASLVQARWLEYWPMAMGLFVSHFATLYARSDGNPNSTVGQAAASGLAFGIQTAKSVGDLSVNYTPVQGLENWGAWNLTSYGQQLATMARIIGMGPLMLW